jgi:hypothetical protein
MYEADHALGVPGVVGNGSQLGLARVAPAVPVSTLGCLSVRAPAHSDPGLRHQGATMQWVLRPQRTEAGRRYIRPRATNRKGPWPTLAHPCDRAIAAGGSHCLVVAA